MMRSRIGGLAANWLSGIAANWWSVVLLLAGIVRTLVDGPQPVGPGSVAWDGLRADGRPVPQGLYFYLMSAAGFRAVERLMVVR